MVNISLIETNNKLREFMREIKNNDRKLYGYDQEFSADPLTGHQMVEIVQVCDGFQIGLIKIRDILRNEMNLSSEFTNFIKSEAYIKIGIGILNDSITMAKSFGYTINGMIDLQNLFHAAGVKKMSMDDLCLSKGFPKNSYSKSGVKWSNFETDYSMLIYAANDAFLSYAFGREIIDYGVMNFVHDAKFRSLDVNMFNTGTWIFKDPSILVRTKGVGQMSDSDRFTLIEEIKPQFSSSSKEKQKSKMFLMAVLISGIIGDGVRMSELIGFTRIYDENGEKKKRGIMVRDYLDKCYMTKIFGDTVNEDSIYSMVNSINERKTGGLVKTSNGFYDYDPSDMPPENVSMYVQSLVQRLLNLNFSSKSEIQDTTGSRKTIYLTPPDFVSSDQFSMMPIPKSRVRKEVIIMGDLSKKKKEDIKKDVEGFIRLACNGMSIKNEVSLVSEVMDLCQCRRYSDLKFVKDTWVASLINNFILDKKIVYDGEYLRWD